MKIRFFNLRDKTFTTWRDIRPGAVFTDYKNETLGNATIFIDQVKDTNKLYLQPLDLCEVDTEIYGTLYMCVDTYTETIYRINNVGNYYTYEIKLISRTKLLEGTVLPNLRITKRKSSPRTILQMLTEYVSHFSPKIKVSGANTSFFALDSSVTSSAKFANECPEMQWNQPTLREVLNDLMMTQDCIPVITSENSDHVQLISFMDLTTIGTAISSDQWQKINYMQNTQTSSEYASEIKMYMQNVTDAVTETEHLSYRYEEGYILTSDNYDLPTQNAVWDLVELKARGSYTRIEYVDVGGTTHFLDINNTVDIDLSAFVFEYGVWSTKPVQYGNLTPSLSADYQNTCLYYNRGAKGIHNFTGTSSGQILFFMTYRKVYEMVYNYVLQKAKELAEGLLPAYSTVNYLIGFPTKEQLTFQIKYQTVSNSMMLTTKNKFQARNFKQVIDNQTTPLANAEKLTLLEYLKTNRLGNEVTLINARYDVDKNSTPQVIPTLIDLGQKFYSASDTNPIVFQRDIAIYEDYIVANYYATPNYVLRDYFTGVKSRLRSWVIEDVKNSVQRNEILKFYVNYSMPNYSSGISFVKGSFASVNDLYSYLNDYTTQFSILTRKEPDNLPVGTEILLEKNVFKAGNSVFVNLTFKDNSTAGKQVTTSVTGGLGQQDVRYVDDNGEICSLFIRQVHITTPFGQDYVNANKFPDISTLVAGTDKVYPVDGFKYDYNIKKDNGEILSITLQFEYNSDANDMFLGKVV